MWRPDDFKNPYGDEWYLSACQHQYNLGEAYETGFNDCLEALKKTGVRVTKNTMMVTTPIFEKANGYVVFIKDDEQDASV